MRRAVPVTATALLLLVLPPSAHAASSVVVRGAGFGHGIGLSQYGAYGYAQKGFSYKSILARYYRSTTLGSAPERPVRVLLQASVPSVRFTGAAVANTTKRLNPTVTYKVTSASGGRVKLSGGGKSAGTFAAPLRVERRGRALRLMGKAINGVSDGTYRGALELRAGTAGGVTAVNSLPLDEYVQGVVAGEMPAGWAMAALQAQAVAARTYGLATRKSDGVFDQYPDTRSQVYRGMSSETPRSNEAVQSTASQIVTYAGVPAVTYFFSSSGGLTENVENSFVGSEPKPWLKGTADPYDGISPKHRWRFRFSPSAIGAKLGAPGRFRKVRVIQRGTSPRIVRARVYGSRGTRLLTGPQIRARLGLYDTWAYFTGVSTSQVKRGRGPRAAGASAAAFPEIAGSFDPAPRGRRLLVERRTGKHWARISEVEVGGHGRYRSTVSTAGVYRVRSGSVAGPPVRIRD